MFQFRQKWTKAGDLLYHPSVETSLYLLLTGLSLFFVWAVPFFVSMDGPAHLYNASLLNEYNSSPLLQEYYRTNPVFFPNCLTHWILALLLKIFPALLCEKVLVSLLIVLLPLTFRLAVDALSGRRSPVSWLVFTLIFNNLLFYGFYNFCFAFIFFNLQIFLLLKIINGKNNAVQSGMFILNSLLLLLTHGFVFAITVLILVCLTLIKKYNLSLSVRKLVSTLLLLLPSLILFAVFFFTVNVPNYNYDIDSYQKWRNLTEFSPGIVFDQKRELGYSVPVFVLLVVLTTSILSAKRNGDKKPMFAAADCFFVLFLLLVYLIFHSTDGLFGGMFLQRLFYLAFYCWILWICCKPVSGWLSLGALIVVCYSFINLALEKNKVMNAVAPEIKAVISAGEKIEGPSTVYVVNHSDTWFRGHFSNYLGVNRPLVLSDNYEAVLDWFPLKWKKDITLLSLEAEKANLPDYVFIYFNPRLIKQPEGNLAKLLAEQTTLIYEAPGHSCALYKVKKPENLDAP